VSRRYQSAVHDDRLRFNVSGKVNVLLDARSLPPGHGLEADICIVGGGAAGLTMALAFADRPLSVVLLESGGVQPDEGSQGLCQGTTTGRPYYALDACRLRYLGGSTNVWGGWCRPLDAIDFEPRAWVPYSGWPFSKTHLDAYYARAHAVCRLGPYDYEPEAWRGPRRTTLVPDCSEPAVDTVFQIAPTRFGDEYRVRLRRAASVRVMLHANAVELEMDASHGTTTCVRAATLAGNRFSVAAKVFVLAAGGIENPRLLLASRRQRPCGVGNERDLVGRFFTEHLHLPVATTRADRKRHDFYRARALRGVLVRGAMALTGQAQMQDELLGCAVTLHHADARDVLSPAAEPESCASLRVLASTIRRRRLPDRAARHAWRVVAGLDEVGALVCRKLRPRMGRSLIVGCRAEQSPNPDSRVTLDDTTDHFDMPRPRVHWELSARDLDSLRGAQKLWAHVFERASIDFTPLRAAPDARWPDRIAPGAHHIGTTRMHTDPAQGVVDENCRVHGTSNLFVAGSSVFPTAGWAPPTLTIVALALRLADRVNDVLADRAL
jgi:choline dehydrogenase-like flavoprotein